MLSPPARHWPDRPEIVAGQDTLAGGSWLGSGNWSFASTGENLTTTGPNGVGVIPEFLAGYITAPAVVTLDGNRTVGGMDFDDTNPFTIAPGTLGSGANNTLTFDDGTNNASQIIVGAGTDTINSTIILSSNGSATNGTLLANIAGGSTLTISSTIKSSGADKGIVLSNAGTLKLTGNNGYAGQTVVNNGTLILSGNNDTTNTANLTENLATNANITFTAWVIISRSCLSKAVIIRRSPSRSRATL